MHFKLTLLAGAVTSLLLGSVQLPAATLNFSDLNPTNTNELFVIGPYVSQGFSVSSTLGFNTYGTGLAGFYAGSSSLSPIGGASVELKATDNSAFALTSIDLARNFLFDPAPTVTFTATLAGGGTAVDTVQVTEAAGTAAFQTFSLTGFNDVVAVSWTQPSDPNAGFHQFTDLTLSAANSGPVTPPVTPSVPEPSSYLLVCAGAGLLIAARRSL